MDPKPPSPTLDPPSLRSPFSAPPHTRNPQTLTLKTSPSERERRAGDGGERRRERSEAADDGVKSGWRLEGGQDNSTLTQPSPAHVRGGEVVVRLGDGGFEVDDDGGWVSSVAQLDQASSSSDKGRDRELAIGVRITSTRFETVTLTRPSEPNKPLLRVL